MTTYRPARIADAADIARVHVETWRVAYAGLLPDAFLAAMSVPAGTARWEAHIETPERIVYVADDSGEVVGFASAGPPRDADAPEDAGEVYAVYVHPAAQRHGHGAALLRSVTAGLAAAGYRSALLWVLVANAPARSFYAVQGGEPDETTQTRDLGGALADEIRYRFVLRPAT